MKVSITILINFILIASLFSQRTYSETEKDDFVRIYFESKDFTNTIPNFHIDHNKYGISLERLKEMMTKRLIGEDIDYTKQEYRYIKEVGESNLILKKEGEAKTKLKLSTYSITWSLYKEMLNNYKTDIAFQRSLKSNFQNYFLSKQ